MRVCVHVRACVGVRSVKSVRSVRSRECLGRIWFGLMMGKLI